MITNLILIIYNIQLSLGFKGIAITIVANITIKLSDVLDRRPAKILTTNSN